MVVGTIGLILLTVYGSIQAGLYGFFCVLCGTALASFSIWSLYVLTRSFLSFQPEPKAGAYRTVMVGILKLPVMLLLIFFGTRSTGAALGCFLGSLGLVYSAFIGFWAYNNA